MIDEIRILFPVSMDSIRLAEDIFQVISNNATPDKRLSYNIRVVFSEAFNNAFLYCDKSNCDAVIEVKASFRQGTLSFSIINEGEGFTDDEVNRDQLPPEQCESGRGLKIIRELSDKLEFNKLSDNRFEVYVEFDTNPIKKQENINILHGGCNGHPEKR